MTADDLHQTALKIQEKSFHGKTKEYLMINVLQGHEFEEWSRYLRFVVERDHEEDLFIAPVCRAGFNILLHGVGSKKSLVELFFKKHLKNEYLTFIIHGYMPNINIKQVRIASEISPWKHKRIEMTSLGSANALLESGDQYQCFEQQRRMYASIHQTCGREK